MPQTLYHRYESASAQANSLLPTLGIDCFADAVEGNRSRREEMSAETSFRTLRRAWTAGADRRRSQLIELVVFAAALLLAWQIGQWVLAASVTDVAKRLAVLAGLVIAIAVFMRWRRGVYLFLVWLMVEDLVRKYSGNNMLIYFTKDALVSIVYAGFLIALARRETRTFRPPFLVPLVCFAGLGLVQVFNPRSPSLFYGILGMKLYFFYVPLMFLSYALIGSEADLRRFFRITLWVGGVVALVGIIQGLGYKNFLNPAHLAPELEQFGHLVRPLSGINEFLNAPPSVFVSLDRYASYLGVLLILTLAYLGYHLLRRERDKLAYLVLTLCGVAIFLCGKRSTLLYGVMSLFLLSAAFLWGTKYQVLARARLTRAIRRSLLALALGIALVSWVFPRLTQRWWAFYYETLWPNSPYYQLAYRVGPYPSESLRVALEFPGWKTGYGIGASSLGTQYVVSVLNQPPSPLPIIENGLGNLLVEMGILAPILWLWWTVALVVSGWKVLKDLKGTTFFPVGFAILWHIFWLLLPETWLGITPYQNFVLNAYLWVLVGILFRLPRLANQSRSNALAATPARPNEIPARAGSI